MNAIQQLEVLANATRCPDWCESTDCLDGYDVLEGAVHEAGVASAGSMGSYISGLTGNDRTPDQRHAWLTQDGKTLDAPLSAQECREAASVLLAAAARLDELDA